MALKVSVIFLDECPVSDDLLMCVRPSSESENQGLMNSEGWFLLQKPLSRSAARPYWPNPKRTIPHGLESSHQCGSCSNVKFSFFQSSHQSCSLHERIV
ncbi:uncharacterized protein LOC103988933 isoform X2 [Musa acuminata AAA Group]|uniref:uncharacterized protein LOC103988933 isoform X2 n=1 Tax=Musa acuminata AAA Group TaxID=214697 RepID=UPI0031E3BA83